MEANECENPRKKKVKSAILYPKPQKKLANYESKPKDFDTYNYLTKDDEEGNVLRQILKRAQMRREERKSRMDIYNEKILEKEKEKIRKEKQKCEDEKQKHKEQLQIIRENFLAKKQKAEERFKLAERLKELIKLADQFYDRLVLKIYFRKFKKLKKLREQQEIQAQCHYQNKLMINSLSKLRLYASNERERKLQIARAFHEKSILRLHFNLFTKVCLDLG